ncbi:MULTISPECIES: hypothetical protein [Bacillaceae]|uniref:hypothetical protein n=1 Tax=Bacillaceae TaxID=186817 RepID=UPI002964D27B|nr:hypothetical protein [Bacillus infantis]MDW2877763.1 hypothetical protein [Bacillus infantis]
MEYGKENRMFITIPLALALFLEFAIEPVFKIREKLFNRLGTMAAGALAITLPFAAWLLLTELVPIEHERVYTFSCIMFTVFIGSGAGKKYSKSKEEKQL